MSDRRALRLYGFIAILAGLLVAGLMLSGIAPSEADTWTVAAGASVAGVIFIVANRPRKRRRPRP